MCNRKVDLYEKQHRIDFTGNRPTGHSDHGKPFYLSDLYKLLEAKYGITNRPLILKILEELCESGTVKYSEVADDDWAYVVVRRMQAYAQALSH